MLTAWLDSGAIGNFIDETVTQARQIPQRWLKPEIRGYTWLTLGFRALGVADHQPRDESSWAQGDYMLWGNLLPTLPLDSGVFLVYMPLLLPPVKWKDWEVSLNLDYCQLYSWKPRGTDNPAIQAGGLSAVICQGAPSSESQISLPRKSQEFADVFE